MGVASSEFRNVSAIVLVIRVQTQHWCTNELDAVASFEGSMIIDCNQSAPVSDNQNAPAWFRIIRS
jgi:hypothetical protein